MPSVPMAYGMTEHFSSLSTDAWAVMLTVVVTGFAVAVPLVGMGWRMSSRLDRRISEDKAASDRDRRAFQNEVAADRRAFQAGIDAFKDEMRHLGNRQSNLEGRIHVSPTE